VSSSQTPMSRGPQLAEATFCWERRRTDDMQPDSPFGANSTSQQALSVRPTSQHHVVFTQPSILANNPRGALDALQVLREKKAGRFSPGTKPSGHATRMQETSPKRQSSRNHAYGSRQPCTYSGTCHCHLSHVLLDVSCLHVSLARNHATALSSITQPHALYRQEHCAAAIRVSLYVFVRTLGFRQFSAALFVLVVPLLPS